MYNVEHYVEHHIEHCYRSALYLYPSSNINPTLDPAILGAHFDVRSNWHQTASKYGQIEKIHLLSKFDANLLWF